ncbi:PREDICTED: putative F-box protein At1g67390-like [Fragaria vesca subsp. vesca]
MAGTNSPRKRIKIDVRYPTNFDPNDRISHLPDDILRHILSLITLHEVGRTSILSKRWQNVRSSNPNLDFDERVFIKNLSDNLTDITRKQKPDLMGKNVRISEHIIQNLILGSPLIESLTLVCCWNVKNIELSSLVNDKKLELQDCGENGGRFERIEFEELKLQSLSYSSDNMVFDINSKFLKTLKVLSIKGRFLTDQLLRRIIRICVRLKSLVLSCSKLKRFEISSLRLKKLSLCDVSEKLDNGVLNTPKLRSFGYDGNNLVPLLFSLDMSSVEDAAVKMSTELNASQLRTFLPEELGDNSSIPSISNIKHLKIELYYPLNEKDNYGALLDGLLWSCHPETLSMELGWGYNDEVAKVLCERLGKIDPRDECCSTACTY